MAETDDHHCTYQVTHPHRLTRLTRPSPLSDLSPGLAPGVSSLVIRSVFVLELTHAGYIPIQEAGLDRPAHQAHLTSEACGLRWMHAR